MKDKNIKKYKKIANKIIKLMPTYKAMSDSDLQNQTKILKERLTNGEKVDKLLPDAFAVVAEADRRVLGLDPYYVQILGGIALFYGNVAEMKTGEGKTLTATMPMYLRGLMGKGNFLITSNSYLAWRDAEEVGKVYRWLGLTISVGVPKDASEEEINKEEVYGSDIVYTTHSALGFDYLFDNLATTLEEQFVNNFNYVLIDEIDAILLDMAQTPLIISGAPKVQSNLFETSDWFVKSLSEGEDYLKSEDRRNVWFTEEGIGKAEKYFGIQGILTEEWHDLYRHLVLSLRANKLLEEDRDYVVEEGEILLLDEANGRKLIGTKLQAGLHQAIEAKEGVEITNETRSMGSITYQNLFKKFRILSGMTGTAKTDAEEFRETYNVNVIQIPTNKPIRRVDHPDEVYITNKAKALSSLNAVKEALKQDRPVLVETGSVAMSNLYSLLLLQQKIPHNLLNATTVAKESLIVSEAGRKGAVTVATSMAGRGTDIKLDPEARESGGLLVLGTERMTSDRIDYQLRGRAGRQGDPGDTVFFVSMEDKIVVESAPKWVAKTRKKLIAENESKEAEETQPLKEKKYDKIIQKSQANRKNQEVESRKNILEYDEVISVQREMIYAARNKVMSASPDFMEDIIRQSVKNTIDSFSSKKANLNRNDLIDFIYNNIAYNFDASSIDQDITEYNKKSVSEYLSKIISNQINTLHSVIPDSFQQLYFKRIVVLKAVDTMWIEQSDNLQQLKAIVNGRSWGQHRPIYEFQIEARRSFFEMKEEIWLNMLRNLLLSDLVYNSDGSIDVDFP
ncbi:accessory Sec system translocase SecA2 [Enterococcus raffinosus]|uniref:accessory Sec system translocase SecA2 n=1 Tax=Enterococcus raffinosus TaxID=71452 RepID=UPI001C0F96E5|nr:accessory Sec system translocase SecA2 [Enterococcus raffinosus]MBU5362862.1 accessory Sec system translocase SecA2 [Enterococcus raffinosus]